jgi:hypothetical protein
MQKRNELKLECEYSGKLKLLLYFLVYFRNKLFLGEAPNKILDFYDGCYRTGQLIVWINEHPKGVYMTYEVDCNMNVLVAKSTADIKGSYTKKYISFHFPEQSKCAEWINYCKSDYIASSFGIGTFEVVNDWANKGCFQYKNADIMKAYFVRIMW